VAPAVEPRLPKTTCCGWLRLATLAPAADEVDRRIDDAGRVVANTAQQRGCATALPAAADMEQSRNGRHTMVLDVTAPESTASGMRSQLESSA
jgi:hypothetical protein